MDQLIAIVGESRKSLHARYDHMSRQQFREAYAQGIHNLYEELYERGSNRFVVHLSNYTGKVFASIVTGMKGGYPEEKVELYCLVDDKYMSKVSPHEKHVLEMADGVALGKPTDAVDMATEVLSLRFRNDRSPIVQYALRQGKPVRTAYPGDIVEDGDDTIAQSELLWQEIRETARRLSISPWRE